MLRSALSLLALLSTVAVAAAQSTDGRLQKITSSGTIKIAHRTDATPFSFVNERKEVTGYTIDICRLVVEAMRQRLKLTALKIEWVAVTTQDRFDAIAEGRADLECGSSTVTLGRMKQVDFSSIVFVESTGFVVRKDAAISAAKDLAGKRIAVIAGTSNAKAVEQANESNGLKAVIVSVKDRAEGVALLESGGADAFASDKLLLVGAQIQNPQALTMLPDDLSIEPYAIALPRGDWALRLAVNSALADIYRKGDIVDVFNRWFAQIGLRPSALLGAAYLLGALSD
jgi:ABC-type amino acid transport substrate-binding protein